MTSKNWCFTVNNYTESDEVLFKEYDCTYMVYGREVGENLTPHLQGYIVLKSPARLSALKKVHAGAHWEVAKGTSAQNRVYCTKQGAYVETGAIPMTSKAKGALEKERWAAALVAAKAGDFDAIPADIYIRNFSAVRKIAALHQIIPPLLAGELINVWYYGPPGTGKTTRAFAENPGSYYLKGLHKWWDGYVAQDVVIIDDMDPYHKSLAQEFKQWAHHFPFSAETKGGAITIRPKKLVVTSNYSIDEIWEDEVTRVAIKRRFRQVYMDVPPPAIHPMFNLPK